MLKVIGKSDKQASGKERKDIRVEQGKALVRYAEVGRGNVNRKQLAKWPGCGSQICVAEKGGRPILPKLSQGENAVTVGTLRELRNDMKLLHKL